MRLDRDVTHTALNQLYRLISGPLMLICIPLFLSAEEQGYWYTFTSVAALSIFADLGFTTIVLQFAAHEFAFLHYDENQKIDGDEFHLHKLADFFRFCMKWVSFTVSIVFTIIVVYGFVFISENKDLTVTWQIPWIIYSVFSAVYFIFNVVLSFFEGCNNVAKTQLTRFKVGVVASLTNIILLFLGAKLYALAMSMCFSTIVCCWIVCHEFGKNIKLLLSLSKCKTYSWSKEFFSLMWRYAISWSGGYFAMMIYTPLAFRYYGSVEAGRIGLSVAICTAMLSVANIFMTARLPILNGLVEQRDWVKAKNLFKSMSCKTIGAHLIFAIGFFALYYLFYDKVALLRRLVVPTSMAILLACWFLQDIVNAIALYIRAHKIEPFWWMSVVSGVYIACSTFYVVTHFSAEYLFVGFLSSFVYGIPYFVWILYIQNKLDIGERK